jgi:hypothetical protein
VLEVLARTGEVALVEGGDTERKVACDEHVRPPLVRGYGEELAPDLARDDELRPDHVVSPHPMSFTSWGSEMNLPGVHNPSRGERAEERC